MTERLTAEEIARYRHLCIEAYRWPYELRLRLLDEIAALQAELLVAQMTTETLAHPCDSPCGHSSQYARSEDGGKNIRCLLCSEANLQRDLAAARKDTARLGWLEENVPDIDWLGENFEQGVRVRGWTKACGLTEWFERPSLAAAIDAAIEAAR